MEKFVITPENLDATIKKKPKEDPVGLFLERFDKALDIDHAVAEKIDFSYLSPAQRAESMWAVFQDAKNIVSHKKDISEKGLRKLRQNVGVLKKFYEDSDTRETYIKNHQRHISEIETINGDAEKSAALNREIRESQKIVDACVRQIFSERGGRSSELDILLFETGKKQLREKRDELDELIKLNPELGGLDQYQKIKEGAEQLQKEHFIWAPSRRKLLEETEEAALSGKPVLLSGESGTGKTRLVEQASLKLTGQINNLTPGKDTRFQDLIAKPKISPEGATYYEYKEIGEAFTGKSSTLENKPQHQGRIVADDEFNLRPESDQTGIMAVVSSWTPGKKVRMPVTNQETEIMPNAMFCAMANLASERYARKKIPPEVLRKFAKVDVGYLEQSAENPEIYETMLSALLDKNGRLRAAKEEMSPLYEFREEARNAKKDGQEVRQTVKIRELKTAEEKNGKEIMFGGFLWRLANALHEINKSFSRKETVLKAKGEAQFLKDLIIDIGTVIGWLKEYKTAGREKSLEVFFADKMQKEFLSREAYSLEDRQLIKEFLKYFDIDFEKRADKEKEDQEFEIMTPLEIGLLSPRVKYEKVVSEEPVLAESYFIDAEGKRVEYRIESIEKGDKKFVPGQIFKMSGRNYEFLGVDKVNSDSVYAPYKGKPKVESRKENATSKVIEAFWQNPETGQEQAIEINLEKTLDEQKVFYKNRLNLEIDDREVISIWNKNYAEIKSEIEKYGYDQVLIVPDSLPEEEILNQSLIETMKEEVIEDGKKIKKKVAATYQGNDFKSDGSFAGVKNSYMSKYRLVLTYSVQNIGDHAILKITRNKNVMQVTGLEATEVNRRIASGEELPVNCEIEINGQKIKIEAEGESLEDYIIQQRMYFDKTGEHLDAKSNSYTRLLKSFSGSRVVIADWVPVARQLVVSALVPGDVRDLLGLRFSRSFSN